MTEDIIVSLRDNSSELDAGVVYRALSTHVLWERKRSQEVQFKNILDPILDTSIKFEARRIKWSQNTAYVWLNAMSSAAYQTALSMDKFGDSLRLCFGLTPLEVF